MPNFNLDQHQLTVAQVHHNLPPSSLYEHAIRYDKDAILPRTARWSRIRA